MDADACGEGDTGELFSAWYEAEYARLLRTLVVVTSDVDLAADATSEAFARALQQWDRVSQMASPSGWTYTVALNVARRMARRARVESVLLHRRPTAPVRSDSLELWDAVQRLPERQRAAVALHYLSDLPQREVAAVMGIAEGTVAATLYEARRRLALVLSDSTHPEGSDDG